MLFLTLTTSSLSVQWNCSIHPQARTNIHDRAHISHHALSEPFQESEVVCFGFYAHLKSVCVSVCVRSDGSDWNPENDVDTVGRETNKHASRVTEHPKPNSHVCLYKLLSDKQPIIFTRVIRERSLSSLALPFPPFSLNGRHVTDA